MAERWPLADGQAIDASELGSDLFWVQVTVERAVLRLDGDGPVPAGVRERVLEELRAVVARMDEVRVRLATEVLDPPGEGE